MAHNPGKANGSQKRSQFLPRHSARVAQRTAGVLQTAVVHSFFVAVALACITVMSAFFNSLGRAFIIFMFGFSYAKCPPVFENRRATL